MRHLRGNVICVVDVETTPYEIWQAGCIPLNPSLSPIEGSMPFEVVARPNFPEKCDRQIMRLSKRDLKRVLEAPNDQEAASNLFYEYCRSVLNRYAGPEAKLLPMGQNWAFDCGKLQMWLGDDVFNSIFHPWYRDPMVVAQFLNDVAFVDVEGPFNSPPYDFANLQYLASKFKVVNLKAHDALQDAATTFKVYREMVMGCTGEFPRADSMAHTYKWLFDLVNERSGKCLESCEKE